MFIPMELAEQFTKYPNKATLYRGNHIIEPKIDGLRCEVTAEGIHSRYGNKWGFSNIIKPLTDFVAKLGMNIDCEIDSLVYKNGKLVNHYDRRRQTMSIVKKLHISDTEAKSLSLVVFDVIPHKGNLKLIDRKKLVSKLVPILKKLVPFNVVENPYYVVHSKEEFDKYYNGFVAQGLEGCMLKNINSIYRSCRTWDWIKLKHKYTSDCPILRVELGTKGKKNENRTGVLVVKTPMGEAKIGTGFPETGKESRDWFFSNKDTIKGVVIEIEHEGYANGDGRLINAAYKCVRWDKPKWEISF